MWVWVWVCVCVEPQTYIFDHQDTLQVTCLIYVYFGRKFLSGTRDGKIDTFQVTCLIYVYFGRKRDDKKRPLFTILILGFSLYSEHTHTPTHAQTQYVTRSVIMLNNTNIGRSWYSKHTHTHTHMHSRTHTNKHCM
jgi:hypothetical protein